MAFLTVNGTDFEGKCSFRFSKLADKKYSKKKEDSDPDNGFDTVFNGLMQFDNDALVAFWDCALDYDPKNKPKVAEIEAALEERFEEDGDSEAAFKEAYEAIDESAFFKKKVQKYWKNIELMKDFGKNEEEREMNKKSFLFMQESKKEIEA